MGMGDRISRRLQRGRIKKEDDKMIRIGQLKLNPDHTDTDLLRAIAKTLRVAEKEIRSYNIKKRSLDARKKPQVKYIYTVDVDVANEQRVLKKQKGNQAATAKDVVYQFPKHGNQILKNSPVVIGSGPAGLFCAYMLAEHGYRPILFERGASVEERAQDIRNFWETGVLNTQSNVQFGEGGAGTFSDGKLNTGVKDPFGRNRKVLEIFVENGAPEEILYLNKPHIGTDILIDVVRNMRRQIISWGGEVHFHSQFVDFTLEHESLKSITIVKNKKETLEKEILEIKTEILILAIGHSARDTFFMLHEKQLPIQAKAFAVGVRAEHLQKWIDEAQYGADNPYNLPSADYKVVTNLESGRGVYSFCMCPGGYVVNASSEEGGLAVNGMSYHARDGKNSNSAIIVTVTPEDFGTNHPLCGMYFQQELEKRAFQIGEGAVPVQRFEDFCKNQKSESLGIVTPQIKGAYRLANVRGIFPEEIAASIECGIKSFDRQLYRFSHPDVVLSGVESRTSSPVKIVRNEALQIENTGIYPCGEGAGYAGGITSAAIDGVKIAEKIAEKFVPFD